MIFIDTSAIYALADRADPNHALATGRFEAILRASAPLFTHNYVVVESLALIQSRLGLDVALTVAQEIRAFEIEWVTERLHEAAVEELARSRARGISLVDQVSFLVMGHRQLQTAFAFDRDFLEQGFDLYETPNQP